MAHIQQLADLDVYRLGMDAAMHIFEASRRFPPEERYSLSDQIRRSSRSVCANIAEAWCKRRYANHFFSKLSDAEAEATETQVWLEFAAKCGSLDREFTAELLTTYDYLLGKLVNMLTRPEQWQV